ncbi:MAG: hypothetical protein Alpg2KO_17500 [Alphaproteobacteria bacterium]
MRVTLPFLLSALAGLSLAAPVTPAAAQDQPYGWSGADSNVYAQNYSRNRNQLWGRPRMNNAYRPPGAARTPEYATEPYVPDPEIQPDYVRPGYERPGYLDPRDQTRSVYDVPGYDVPGDTGYNPWGSGTVETQELEAVDDDGRVVVALLLPLTGKAEGLGRAMLNAAQQALFDRGVADVTVLVRDTGGTTKGATRAATEVVEDGADLVLGPLFSANAAAVKQVLSKHNLPMITFSTDRGIAGNGAYVMGFQPRNQVDRVLTYAMSRGYAHAAALVPDDAYGKQLEDQITETARLTPLITDRPARFRPGGNADHRDAVRRAAQQEARKQKALEETGEETPLPEPEFDMVLLGAGGETLRALTPLLAYYDVDRTKVKYLGTGLWDDASLSREPDLQGGWFAAPAPASRSTFEQNYAQSFGDRPPRLATLAYDAMALASVLGSQPVVWGEPSPFGFAALTDERGFRGTDGLFRFRADGLVERALAVLEITRTGPRVIDTAPDSFEVQDQYGSFRLPASAEIDLDGRY